MSDLDFSKTTKKSNYELYGDAADEIERLHDSCAELRNAHSEKCAEIERLTGSNNRLHVNGTADGLRIDDLTFENTKLRAALERIKYDCSKCKRTAREALETDDE